MSLPHPDPIGPHGLWGAWSLEPGIVLGLAAAGGLYAVGARRLWRAVGAGHALPWWRAGCYMSGLGAIALALLSPLDALAEATFWGHMIQHLVLILVAAPLLVVGAPLLPVLWLPGPAGRRRLGAWWHRQRTLRAAAEWLTTPLVVWLLQAAVLWAWHLPAAYQAALHDQRLHALEHLSFLATAVLFWWVVLQPAGRRRMNYGMSLLYVVTAGMQSGLLGALLTFGETPLYPAQSVGASAWGLSALADQQLAGLLMWLPAGLVYVAVASALFVLWLRTEETRMARRAAAARGGTAPAVVLAGSDRGGGDWTRFGSRSREDGCDT